MRLRHPWAISAVARVIAWAVRLHGPTVRYVFKALGPTLWPTRVPGQPRYLYALWHESLLPPAYLYRHFGVRVLVSRHSDGELATRAIHRLGYSTVRGSTNRGGVTAIREVLSLGGADHLVFPVDGPRGPRRTVQPGIAYVGSRARLPIVCVGIGFSDCWRCNSWDRFAIPKPGSKVVFVTDEPMVVPEDAGRDELAIFHARVQRDLDRLSDIADRMAGGDALPNRAAA